MINKRYEEREGSVERHLELARETIRGYLVAYMNTPQEKIDGSYSRESWKEAFQTFECDLNSATTIRDLGEVAMGISRLNTYVLSPKGYHEDTGEHIRNLSFHHQGQRTPPLEEFDESTWKTYDIEHYRASNQKL